MKIEFRKVNDQEHIRGVADTAREIWFEYFPGVISVDQVRYMVEKFQSADAITRQIAEDGYRYFLVTGDGDILGYLAVRDDGDRLFVSKLYLKKQFRGKGYFSVMLSFIEEMAGDGKYKSLYLTVNRHNDHAIAVYRKKGFGIAGEQVTDIGNGFVMDDYIMEKALGEC